MKVLKASVGEKNVEYDETKSKEDYISCGFEEIEVGLSPDQNENLPGNIQARRKQYGLRHYVTSTIHACQGDTIISMATEISQNNANFKMWDKGQMIAILSHTKKAKDTIFVGDKNDTLHALKLLLTMKTQWTDYMEDVISVIMIGSEQAGQDPSRRILTQAFFLYAYVMCLYPNVIQGMYTCLFR